MQRRRPLLVLVTILFLFGALFRYPTPVATQELAAEQILKIGLEGADITTLDPHLSATSLEGVIASDLFSGLVRFKPGIADLEKMEPDLATDWSVSADNLTWTFRLRKGVKFHKGYGELTAEDVQFSLDRVRDPNFGAASATRYLHIDQVEAVDPYTVTIHLKGPDAFLLTKVANMAGGYVVSQKAVEKLGKDFRLNPVGTGAFVFQEYAPKQKVVLVRNEEFYRKPPTLERIEMIFMPNFSTRELALRKGEIHMMRGKREQRWVEKLRQEGIIVEAVGVSSNSLLHFNMTAKPLDDVRVRMAIAYAINREELHEFAGKDISEIQLSPVDHHQFGGMKTGLPQYEYNVQKAKALLQEAGYPHGFTLRMMITEREDYRSIMEVIQAQLKQAGINLELTVVDHPTYHSRSREGTNPVVLYFTPAFPSADVILTNFFHSKSIVTKPTGVTNFSHYDKIDDLIDQATNEGDLEKRRVLYQEAQKKIMEDLPAYPTLLLKVILARQPYVDLGYDLQQTLNLHYIHEYAKLLKH
jgi:peptide/nickel transport system substrate-binding protein